MTLSPELLAMIKDVKPATDEEIDAWLEGKNLIRYAAVMSLISRIVAERKAVIAECKEVALDWRETAAKLNQIESVSMAEDIATALSALEERG